jgi:hypothetical protein
MQSRATFDLDHSNAAIIRAEIIATPDVRDKIAKRFIESLGHTSQWCGILPISETEYMIFPIGPHELKEQAKQMLYRAEELERQTASYAALVEGNTIP